MDTLAAADPERAQSARGAVDDLARPNDLRAVTSPPLKPGAILAALDRHHVDYVLIGGFAAQQHGATRATEDIDITPATDPETWPGWPTRYGNLGWHPRQRRTGRAAV